MSKDKNEQKPKRMSPFLIITFVVVILLVALLGMVFDSFILSFKEQIKKESANHLNELDLQVKNMFGFKVSNDWSITRSIANSIISSKWNSTEDLKSQLEKISQIWKMSNVFVFTANGNSFDSIGRPLKNDAVSDLVVNAIEYGSYLSIIESSISYTIPVETDKEIEGSQVLAVSVVQDLKSFLDSLDFKAFENSAYLVLTRGKGTVISSMNHSNAPQVFNFVAELETYDSFECLSYGGLSLQEGLEQKEPLVFLATRNRQTDYVTIHPIDMGSETWFMFLVAPESIVNHGTNIFRRQLSVLTFSVIGLFSILSVWIFLMMYSAKKRGFEKALQSRDKLFEFLGKNTTNAFALFDSSQEKPLFISSNSEDLFSEEFISLIKNQSGKYQLITASGLIPASVMQINKELFSWDGTKEFLSSPVSFVGNGMQRYFGFHIYLVPNSENEFIMIARDVTQDRQREETMKNALAMAESANVAKTQFLTSMSHDIRTPMNAIINMTKFAIEENQDEVKRLYYLQKIEDASNHLLRLINDVLDVSRIESGKLVINSEAFNLKTCINEVSEMILTLCEKKGLNFIVRDAKIPDNCVLVGDKLKLSQVLINLLNNAVKFTPEHGSIKFTILPLRSMKTDRMVLRFMVEDNGIGISEKDISKIFNPFSRVENSQTAEIEGSGLGLTICKNFITAMGGSISVKSQEGMGSTFTIELTLEKDSSAPLSRRIEESHASFAGFRALMVDDNDINREIAIRILGAFGFIVETAINGQDALQMFNSSVPGYYDIIFMDIQMPVMDGYEATEAIRFGSHPMAKLIPIVAMTANVFAEDIEKARAAGMNGHIGKPLNINELIAEAQKCLAPDEGGGIDEDENYD